VQIDHYAVFGNPINHSKSPFIHQQFAQATQQRMVYKALLASRHHFALTLQHFFAQGGKGCNITLPFKEEAYQACTRHTERASAAKAVNTIMATPEGLLGDNTDGIGLLTDINHYITLKDRHILVLGAGGAARGILLPLLQALPASITIANRTVEKAALLCQEFSFTPCPVHYVALTDLPIGENIIINATSASLQQSPILLPDAVFSSAILAYDMMYGATLSPFLQQAVRCQVPYTLDGLGMLVYQAAEAFYLWRGIYPETDVVLKALRSQLSK
jgi:shikimate dehydrogenase